MTPRLASDVQMIGQTGFCWSIHFHYIPKLQVHGTRMNLIVQITWLSEHPHVTVPRSALSCFYHLQLCFKLNLYCATPHSIHNWRTCTHSWIKVDHTHLFGKLWTSSSSSNMLWAAAYDSLNQLQMFAVNAPTSHNASDSASRHAGTGNPSQPHWG